MSSVVLLFTMFLVHWVADFVIQTRWQAANKSTDNWALTKHIVTYTIAWVVPAAVIFKGFNVLCFLGVTFVAHWITDYVTGRLNTGLLKQNNYHDFFVCVGFDQILHYTQLLLTYLILI